MKVFLSHLVYVRVLLSNKLLESVSDKLKEKTKRQT